mgnify:CR=1 FL=1
MEIIKQYKFIAKLKAIILNKNDKRVIINFLGSDYETILFVKVTH